MIRTTTQEDTAAIVELSIATGMFGPEEAAEIEAMLTAWLGGGLGPLGEGHAWVSDVDDASGCVVGVAYYTPEMMTDGAWNLLMIAVHPDHQGLGRGAALLEHIERTIAADGARMLLVETSGLDQFAKTRVFYEQRGYTREATISDYYEPGDDLVLYRKRLGDR